jgi:hypothetical protein
MTGGGTTIMAKKTSKKAAAKPAKKAGKAGAKKVAAKPAPRKTKGGASGAAKSGGPYTVKTGSGPSPAEIGADLVSMFNQGKIKEIEGKWWSPAIESVEGMGMAWRGRAAVEGKNAEWYANNSLNGASAEGPFVGASGFAVKFKMDVQEKASGKRIVMDEVGVYTVQNGKIVREEFMYGGM